MRVLVTGGGGFLGCRIALRLHALGHDTAVFGRRLYDHFPAGIECVQGDLRNREDVSHALEGREAVFHAAALTGIWGDSREFEAVNVQGTRNILDACRERGVHHLIHTSSPSVVYNQKDIEGGDESLGYPDLFLCDYARTKAEAERMVLAAHGDGLETVALRPHLIWGPGDPHLVPRIIERARRGQLVRVGLGTNRVDLIYIDNAVEGHVRALEALQTGRAGGKVYFLSDGAPVNLWEWIGRLLKELNLPAVERSISLATGKRLGFLLETAFRLLGLSGEPRMTRFLAGQLATSHYFDITRAREEIGYDPPVTPEEGMQRLLSSLRVPQAG